MSSGFEIKILDTAAAVKLFRDLGLQDAATALLAGDYIGAFNIFTENMAGVFSTGGLSEPLKTVIMFAITKYFLKMIPGTGKEFNFLGIKLSL